nr:hypothetical protein [Tanacetum cinerariifolium]
QEKLYLLHMDLCGPMRVGSINGKKYILVIVDDYSRFTWVKFLRSKDETSDFIINENLSKLQPKADIGIFIGYAPSKKAFRIYNRRTRRIVETIHVDFDELTAMASKQHSSGPAFNEMTPGTISSGLVLKSSPSASYVPPSRNDWDLLFQPLFNELLNPPPSVVNQAAKDIAHIAEVIPQVDDDSTGSPSSTTVDQDAPSSSKSLTPTEIQSSVILQEVGNDNLDIEVAHMGNDPLLGVPIPEVTFEKSSSTASPQSNVQPNHPMTYHNSKWIKDHPLNNIIGQLSRPVSTRLQLHEQALFCYYDAFLTSVWELVPRPDKVMVITLKWIYKVKLDELGGILKNKARLVAHGYRQEEGIDFEESFASMRIMLAAKILAAVRYVIIVSALSRLLKRFSGSNIIHQEERQRLTFGLQISQNPRGIFINQSKYALESLKKYGFESCDPVDTPMVEKSKLDEDKEGKAVDPSHYRDADHAGCQDTCQSTSGSVLFLGERLISWSSKRQKSTAISSTKAEYIALSGCCAQILWMRSQLLDYGLVFNKIPIYCDNKSAIALCCNNV